MKYLGSLLLLMVSISCGNDEEVYSLSMEEEVLAIVNEYRNSKGLKSLAMNQVILEEARIHSYNMANGTVAFGHDGFGDRIKRIKQIIGGGGGSENVAYGYQDAQSVVNGWLGSSGHRKNIEGAHDITGIGICKMENGAIYYTQIFMKE